MHEKQSENIVRMENVLIWFCFWHYIWYQFFSKKILKEKSERAHSRTETEWIKSLSHVQLKLRLMVSKSLRGPNYVGWNFDQLVKYFSCGGTLQFPGNLSFALLHYYDNILALCRWWDRFPEKLKFASKENFNILPLFVSPLSITIRE